MSGNVKVVSRFRPPNALELREGGDIVVEFDGELGANDHNSVKVKGATSEAGGFVFDKVFDMQTRQQDVFEYGIKETVDGMCSLLRARIRTWLIIGAQMSSTVTMEPSLPMARPDPERHSR